jgi:c-di-GMP-binding flagellar brake protein YcgR
VERRRAEHLHIPLKIKYKIKGIPGPQEEIPLEDISGLGVRLCLKKPLKINKEVEISIYMSDSPEPIEAVTKVVWCKEFKKGEFKAGLEFIRIKDRFRFAELLCKTMLELSLK